MEKRLRNLYDAYGWARDTAEALRAGNIAAIDMEELIDEIASIASGLRRELSSTLNDLIEAMLILTYTQGDAREARRQLIHAQGQLRLLLSSTASIQEAVPEELDEAYQCAKGYVIEDFGVSLPERCPFTLEQLMKSPHDSRMTQEKLA